MYEPQNAESFTLFSKLPISIRVRIWEFFPGRIIPIFPLAGTPYLATLPTVVPALLHVNQESRKVGLKTYEFVHFARATRVERGRNSYAQTAWMDSGKDTLYFVDEEPNSESSRRNSFTPKRQTIAPSTLRCLRGLKKTRYFATSNIDIHTVQELCKAWPWLESITIVRRNELGSSVMLGPADGWTHWFDADSYDLIPATEWDFGLPPDFWMRRFLFLTMGEQRRKGRVSADVLFCDIVSRD